MKHAPPPDSSQASQQPSNMDPDRTVKRSALLVVQDPTAVGLIHELTERGFDVAVESDPVRSLGRCRKKAPDLMVVDEVLPETSGIRLIAEVLKVSWTTAAILISDKSEEEVHEATEGLGILGHVRNYHDVERFRSLLDTFTNMVSPGR